jgi:hypothetical protein
MAFLWVQDGDRERAEDRRDQRHHQGDGECEPVGLRTLSRPARHDRGDQGERGDRFVRLGREGAAPGEVVGAHVLTADVAEVRDVG